jgi:hypothetical protein
MLIDYKQVVKELYSEDKRCGIILFKEIHTEQRLPEWVKHQDVKLLTLDGTYGGVSGKLFVGLTTDAETQDDWHIGKKYDAQTYIRFNTVLMKNEIGDVTIRLADNNEYHNSYLVVSKQHIRLMSKNLLRAKTSVIEEIANGMVESYIDDFNSVSTGEYYTIRFVKNEGNSMYVDDVTNLCGNVDETMFDYVIYNCPYSDSEYEELLHKLLKNVK